MNRCTAPLALVIALACLASGCQQLDLLQRNPSRNLPTATAENPVREIICLWEPAEGTDMDGFPCRGFAGQLMFFPHSNVEPVRVDGTVRIFVADDQGTIAEQSKPLHTYEFPDGSWEKYLRPTKSLGATYQIFLPYTRKGRHQATCTLRVVYEPRGGIPIWSKEASIVLVGDKSSQASSTATPVADRSAARDSGISRASYAELKQIAAGGVTPALAQQAVSQPVGSPAAREAEKARVRSRLAAVLGEEQTPPAEEHVRWDPQHERIVPQQVQPMRPAAAGEASCPHPLQLDD